MRTEKPMKNEIPKRRRAARIALWILIGITVIFILTRSMSGQSASQSESQRITDLIRAILGTEKISDAFVRKLAHFAEFFALGAELSASLWLAGRRTPQAYGNVWFAGVLVALCDETVQIFSHRGSQVQDVWLDIAGATCGILLLFGIRAIAGTVRRKQGNGENAP